MTEFKKGDKVVWKGTKSSKYTAYTSMRLLKDKVYEVTTADYGDGTLGFIRPNGRNYWWVAMEDFELYTEPSTITLNGVDYMVENIPGKGECLVPVKPTPQTAKKGSHWRGVKGGSYVVIDDEQNAFELASQRIYKLPVSATFVKDEAILGIL